MVVHLARILLLLVLVVVGPARGERGTALCVCCCNSVGLFCCHGLAAATGGCAESFRAAAPASGGVNKSAVWRRGNLGGSINGQLAGAPLDRRYLRPVVAQKKTPRQKRLPHRTRIEVVQDAPRLHRTRRSLSWCCSVWPVLINPSYCPSAATVRSRDRLSSFFGSWSQYQHCATFVFEAMD